MDDKPEFRPIVVHSDTRKKFYEMKEDAESWDEFMQKVYIIIDTFWKLLARHPELNSEVPNELR